MQKPIREVRILRILIIAARQRGDRAHRHRAKQKLAAQNGGHGSSLPPVIIGGSTFGTISTSTR